jgi:hypothetical protein
LEETMPLWLETIGISFIGTFLAGLIAVAAKLPEKLIDHAFGGRLADLKHEHDKRLEIVKGGLGGEIEKLRMELSFLSDRGVRSNEREYAAIVAAWEQFVEAFRATQNAIAFFTTAPDFNNMDRSEAEKVLKGTALSENQRDQVLGAPDRMQMYNRVVRQRNIITAGQAIHDSYLVVRKQGIFIPETLEDAFAAAIDMLNKAQVEVWSHFSFGGALADMDDKNSFAKNGQTVFDALKAKVREHLMVASRVDRRGS